MEIYLFPYTNFSRCLLDTDDEVRDRATFYVNVLKEKEKALSSGYILNGELPNINWRTATWRISIEGHEIQTKAFATANQNEGDYYKQPIRTWKDTCKRF